jgi:hypothetical protein
VVSTAGPFISDEELTIDLTTRRFHGVASGTIGDRASRPYATQFSGACTPAPPGPPPRVNKGAAHKRTAPLQR